MKMFYIVFISKSNSLFKFVTFSNRGHLTILVCSDELHSIVLFDIVDSAEENEPEKMKVDDDELDLLSHDDRVWLTNGFLTVLERKNKKKKSEKLC